MILLKPTLTKRVMFAVLLAMVLIWFFLMAFEYCVARWVEQHGNPALTEFNVQVIDALNDTINTADAAMIAASTDRMISKGRERAGVGGVFVFQLLDNKGHIVYRSADSDASLLESSLEPQRQQVISGKTYQVATMKTQRWTVVSGQSLLNPVWILKQISSEITLDVLVSIPVALLPVWLAVSTGLRPLRRISERIAKRSADDLSPIGVSSKYMEIKPLVTELDDLLLKLKTTIHRERGFVHDAAHELRTPMAVISVQAHALTQAKTGHDQVEAERSLNAALKRASHLVHQLLLLARLDNPVRPERTAVDVAQLLRRDLTAFASLASENNIELNLEAPDQLMLSIAVPAFQSVINNLVDNAIRYGRTNGHITITLQRDDSATSLTVVDDGPGISATDHERVFERFFRGSGLDVSGTGLGLAIVKQAASVLGGTIELTNNTAGIGCCFALRIPH